MFEGAEGKRIVMAMRALEEKILAKVEKSLAGMRVEMMQANANLAAEVETHAAEQKELCSKVDDMNMEAFESRSDLLERLEDIKAEISQDALDSRIDLLASIEELDMKIKGTSATVMEMSSVERQLEQDIAQRGDFEFNLQDITQQSAFVIESLETQLEKDIAQQNGTDFGSDEQDEQDEVYKAEVQALAYRPSVEAVAPDVIKPRKAEEQNRCAVTTSACSLDMSQQPAKSPPTEHDQDMWSALPTNLISGVPYSSKMSMASVPFSRKPAPLAQGFNIHRPRPVGRMSSCHSAPVLEPLF
jgi:hypothetical protein